MSVAVQHKQQLDSSTDKDVLVCEKCFNVPEKLQACGATQYFCNTCNTLLSKTQLVHRPSSDSHN